jgi:hypothetical protein
MDLDKEKWEWIWSKPNYHIFNNAECVKCNKVEREMVRIGAVFFCGDCVKIEFNSDNPVRDERKKYLNWLHIQHKKFD